MNAFSGDDPFRISNTALDADEARRVETLLGRMDRAIAKALADYLNRVRSPSAVKAIARMIADGKTDDVLSMIEGFGKPVGLTIAEQAFLAAKFEAGGMEAKILTFLARAQRAKDAGKPPPAGVSLWSEIPEGPISISFDPGSPDAAALMRDVSRGFLSNVRNANTEVIRGVIAEGLASGEGPDAVARRIVSHVGLAPSQARTLDAYRKALETLSRDALRPSRRDARSDGIVKRAIEKGKPLEKDRVEKLIATMRERLIRDRATRIAQNESAAALSRGRELAEEQAIAQSGVPSKLITREWRSMRDERVRLTHIVMDGQTTTKDGVFISPSGAQLRYPHDPAAPASETVGCRCWVRYIVGKPAKS